MLGYGVYVGGPDSALGYQGNPFGGQNSGGFTLGGRAPNPKTVPVAAAAQPANLQSTSKSSSFSGIEDPATLELLKTLITQLQGGGTETMKAAKAAKDTTVSKLDELMGSYSKEAAFQDAANLMQQQLNKAMEANKPAIQRAVEGAGTSAGSMQALLSSNLARDSSVQAGALGAEQAKVYGQILANLMSQRGALTNGKDEVINPLLQALDLMKINRQDTTQTGYFSPQQMNVETQADKLAQIQAQSDAALQRTLSQATGPSSYGGSSGGFAPMDFSGLLKMADTSPVSLGGGGAVGQQLPGYSYPKIGPDGTVTWTTPTANSNNSWYSSGGSGANNNTIDIFGSGGYDFGYDAFSQDAFSGYSYGDFL